VTATLTFCFDGKILSHITRVIFKQNMDLIMTFQFWVN